MAKNFDLNNIGSITGLSEAEAAVRLARDGFNEVPSAKKQGFFSITFNVLREPMLLLLITAGAIYMTLGDIQEALILLSFVFVIIGITLYQERKSERALEALRDLSSPRALVIRDGRTRRIAGREVVCGDIIVLAEGDRVPADGILVAENNLTVEESLLTGESAPVPKAESETITAMGRPGGGYSPFVYSGTLVVGGLGIARVEATGSKTEFGKIGKSLQKIEPEETRVKRETRLIVRNLALIGAALCVIMAVVYGSTRGDWLAGFLASITLAMAILPEEFPVVLTVFMALGAWRISQSRVLTRRLPAIETLGSNTVLCVDKTGTLTMNLMSVKRLCVDGHAVDVDMSSPQGPSEIFHPLIEFSILASQTNPFDPMEKALKQLGDHYRNLTEHLHSDWVFMREYPLSKKLLALSRVWKSPDEEKYIIAAKGAPESIFDLCHLNETRIQALTKQIEEMAGSGHRVLAVARSHFMKISLPADQHVFDFEFLGLLGFADPIRPEVPAAIKESYKAGVRVVMITGDYPVTARNIARQIGLAPADRVLTGIELNEINDEELRRRVTDVNIFARVVPEQKLRLVNAFKANGEIVAMTGDGVNDAPALKSANIGIAMGGRGTDVAREAGALVLLDDDFSSIIKAIRLGRRIFDNLRKAMSYIFAVHVPIAGLSLLPVIFGWPLMLLPVHVVFIELIIDPACSIAFEAEPAEPDIMERPPRSRKEPLLGTRTIFLSLLQGGAVLLAAFVIYAYYLSRGNNELDARTIAFTTLVIANLGLILSNRLWAKSLLASFRYENKPLYLIIAATTAVLFLVIYVPVLRDVFHFGILHFDDWIICVMASLACVVWFELVKYFGRTKRAKP